MINPFGLISTIVFFKFSQYLKRYPVIRFLSPILIAGILIILILKIFNIDYSTYKQSASILTYLLAPATIALGYPLYKNLNLLTKYKRVIYTSFFIATILSLLSIKILGHFWHLDNILIASLMPKSVTAPIAIEVSKSLNGLAELTASAVVLTGIVGSIIGHKILKLIKVKNDVAIGLAIGAASHVIGTSKCIEANRAKQVVMSTVALVIVGILTVVFAPIIYNLIK